MNWYLAALKKYAEFSGRARRKEYWMFLLFNLIFSIVLALLDQLLGTVNKDIGLGVFGGLYSLAVLLPGLALSVRRLHDVGKRGWWLLLALIPLIGGIWLFVLTVTDSQPGANQYGPNLKEDVVLSGKKKISDTQEKARIEPTSPISSSNAAPIDWTMDVADSGQASNDPLGHVAASVAVSNATAEQVFLVMQKVSDVAWGGFMNLYLTDRRLVVDKVMGTIAGAGLAAGVVGLMVASNVARQRGEQALALGRTPDEVLGAAAGNYAIDYSAVSRLVLKRKVMQLGYSQCKVESAQKNVTLAFKREYFDQVVDLMRQVLGDKVEVS